MNNKYSLIIKNKCINRNIITQALKVVPHKDLRNLSIIMCVYPPASRRRKEKIRYWKYCCRGTYFSGTKNRKPRAYIYLGPVYENTSKHSTPFFRNTFEQVMRTLYHEIGHHHQCVVHYMNNLKKYRKGGVYHYKTETNADNYAEKIMKKAEHKRFYFNITDFIKQGYIAHRRYKQQKNRETRNRHPDMSIIHEIRASSVGAEYPTSSICDDINSKLSKYHFRFSHCNGTKEVTIIKNRRHSNGNNSDYSNHMGTVYPSCKHWKLCKKLRQNIQNKTVNRYAISKGLGKKYIDSAGRKHMYYTHYEYGRIVNHFVKSINIQIPKNVCTATQTSNAHLSGYATHTITL